MSSGSQHDRALSGDSFPEDSSSPHHTYRQLKINVAHFIVRCENTLRVFAVPLMLAGFFVALAWLGVFAELYPWVHLAALVFFTAGFFQALGKARAIWKPATLDAAKRRVEEATGLSHRPLDVLEDRPIALDETQQILWREHKERAEAQVQKLRWPKWKLSFRDRDPYALRYALVIILGVAVMLGWGTLGGRLLASINPALGRIQVAGPTLNAWITPPEYTRMPPIMIATPAGPRHKDNVIEVPEGSTVTAHIVEDEGEAPTLTINQQDTAFEADDHNGFGVTQTITSGDRISIHRGWNNIDYWRIRVIPDKAPQIRMAEPPSVSERKSVKLAYNASDDYGVTTVTAHITPKESLPGASSDPLDIVLSRPDGKDVKRSSFEDLTAHPWAGLRVQIQLIASDAAGHQSSSETVDFTLPERIFFQPLARALIEERKKLLQLPFDDGVRNEAANIMAGIAQRPSAYRNDFVVLMALRSGAVRLVLQRSKEATPPVSEILWQTAVRIEDGEVGMAENNLRQAQKELADALDRNANEAEIQNLIDRLHQALQQYLAELGSKMARQPGPMEDLSQFMGQQDSIVTPGDLDRMLEQMRNLSATGARDAARQELAKLQQLLESLQTDRQEMTAEQRAMMKRLSELKQLTKDQQALLDKTFRDAQNNEKQNAQELAGEQKDLQRRLQEIMGGIEGDKPEQLQRGADAMGSAKDRLDKASMSPAVQSQNEALKALQQASQDMMEEMRQSMMMLPMPGMGMFGEKSDPFGRGYRRMQDDGSIKVPDQMQARKVREILNELQRRSGDMNRSKTERDYIERLLQNF